MQTAVDDAIRCFPPELVRLTEAYLFERPHRWSSFGSAVVEPATGDSAVITYANDSVTSWHRLVSDSPFADGQLIWSVEFQLSRESTWFAAGITRSIANFGAGTSYVAPGNIDDCTIVLSVGCRESDDLLNFYIGTKQYKQYRGISTRMPRSIVGRFQVDFAVDPTTGSVIAGVWHLNRGSSKLYETFPLVVAADWKLLRPCVVIGQRMTVVVRSGGGSS